MDENVHETFLPIKGTVEITPPHEKRRESETYKASHEYLIYKQDTPCLVCGVRNSTLKDPTKNIMGAKQMETHHYPIEWSMMNACSIDKVHKKFPQVINEETFHAFVDSPGNLLVLCDVHHRGAFTGIHNLLAQDFAILEFLKDAYVIITDRDHAKLAEAHDEEILKTEGPGD